ncbi:MAG: hypothetical protein A2622_11185 [Bdellovibrionales bacterium RIFCSPHIGHO2_01_FULL_40_29]|nr:MAG: hypothetical protein A2622_11185 [Bdellovibrionales bacterium RIFCSPHIGHO2_01_FULL_40_29]OFZ34514.1 MAG: hypothetical protein A3D17_01450 [Bdellovibrionales bacterium RIFCSPHIGHO2_02_FULL_40_15]
MWIEASAPSNIALIKYMGKTDPVNNRPCNSSLSYTLDHLRTFVRLQPGPQLLEDQWRPFVRSDLRPIELSETGKKKFLSFFAKLKKEFNLSGFYHIESANNFPSDCGLASSASSFAALTRAAYACSTTIQKSELQLALISKLGSGSSCRSFSGPWVKWTSESIEPVALPISNLKHQVILCDESIKAVSSSQAHQLVLTSELFLNRPERAEKRLQDLSESLSRGHWEEAFQICWNEFWDMHVLFHTSKPPFMYMTAGSQQVLRQILELWRSEKDGPLVTMDAGSNIHLLYRPDQTDTYKKYKSVFNPSFPMWTDEGYCAKS